jgi:uncharacterized membrane protein YfcA
MDETQILTMLIFLAAILYASVGQAGASGYLAAMALVGVSADIMKPAALLLNVVVSAITVSRFQQREAIAWRLLWPFVVGSLPMAFIGGAIHLRTAIYHPAVGIVLLATGLRMLYSAYVREQPEAHSFSREVAMVMGAIIGLVAGLTGTGGGIMLAPLLIVTGWAIPRDAAGTSAAFILINSAAALVGNLTSMQYLPQQVGVWAVAAAAGGYLGAELGSRYLAPRTLHFLLAAVLLLAGAKLLFT